LIRLDFDNNEPVRDDRGFCVRSGTNEPGEAIGRLASDATGIGGRFEGYTDSDASGKKMLQNVFEPGDIWVRTGDLMRKDEKGFFYFVDRIGDTFRWKGENVATSEVSAAIHAFPGVKHVIVYGVSIPGADGRAGMAAIVVDHELDLSEFRKHLLLHLPAYARPVFLRLSNDVDLTGTFKYSRTELVREGFDPCATGDIIYFDNQETQTFDRVDLAFCGRVEAGLVRI
jgi:fatty-acyl-CoA synthase